MLLIEKLTVFRVKAHASKPPALGGPKLRLYFRVLPHFGLWICKSDVYKLVRWKERNFSYVSLLFVRLKFNFEFFQLPLPVRLPVVQFEIKANNSRPCLLVPHCHSFEARSKFKIVLLKKKIIPTLRIKWRMIYGREKRTPLDTRPNPLYIFWNRC